MAFEIPIPNKTSNGVGLAKYHACIGDTPAYRKCSRNFGAPYRSSLKYYLKKGIRGNMGWNLIAC